MPAKKSRSNKPWKILNPDKLRTIVPYQTTKPKRQNWKALANHREGALIVMADVNRAQSEKITQLTADLRRIEMQVGTVIKFRNEYWERAEAAEKHNAILLAERDERVGQTFHLAQEKPGLSGECEEVEYCLCGETAPNCNCAARFGRKSLYQRFQARTASLSRRVWDFIRCRQADALR